MNERLKKLRKALGLTQQEFADKLRVSRSNIATYEVGKNNPTDAVINLICREFNVNETWLRTGEGDMFIESDDSILSQLAREYKLDSFEKTMVSNFLKLPPEQRKVIQQYVRSLVDDLPAAPAFAPAPEPDYEAETRAEAEEYYRQRLMEKEAEAESSVSSGSGRKKA